MNLSKNAMTSLQKRYLKKNADGTCEAPEEMFRRVAKAIAAADNRSYYGDKLEDEFYKMMTNLDFLPNSPTMMNAGRDIGQLSACFVLPIDDSMESIFDSVKNAALIHKSGGGTGFSFSRLRPANDKVKTTGGVSSGPISFMKVFDIATESVKQSGLRRGANMGLLRVDHPDILEFIKCKTENNALNNFNISVGITDAFMEALKNDAEYSLINPRTKKESGKLSASMVFNLIVEQAWKNGEPGIIFLDEMNRYNPTPQAGEYEATNPCGEMVLLPNESCNLGSINLANFVLPGCIIDYGRLSKIVEFAVIFLDNVIEANKYPLPEIEKITKSNRKIGIGVMGWADFLIKMNIPYNSDKALEAAEDIMSFIQTKAWEMSDQLGAERGIFPNYIGSALSERLAEPVRNATVTTIAPTGSISIIANCSSGIEPLFAVAYEKHVLNGEKLVEINPAFVEKAKAMGFYSEELMKKISQHASIQEIEEIPLEVRRLFVTAHDVSPYYHVKMQAAFQSGTCNAVSKTVNLSHSATKEDVRNIYLLAHDLGCKGITVYRDGSRNEQVLNAGSGNKQGEKKVSETKGNAEGIHPRERPPVTTGITEKVTIGCGSLFVTVNSDSQGICEVFTHNGKSGGCPSQSEATARLISLALRSGINGSDIIDQMQGIRCHSTKGKNCGALSCPDAIARVMISNQKHNTEPISFLGCAKKDDKNSCPECNSALSHESGCVRCVNCDYSKCG